MTNKLEGGGHGLIKVLSRHLPGRMKEKHENSQKNHDLQKFKPSKSGVLLLQQPVWSNIIMVNESRRMRWQGHVTCIQKMKKILIQIY
jgi:hypothetical protein